MTAFDTRAVHAGHDAARHNELIADLDQALAG